MGKGHQVAVLSPLEIGAARRLRRRGRGRQHRRSPDHRAAVADRLRRMPGLSVIKQLHDPESRAILHAQMASLVIGDLRSIPAVDLRDRHPQPDRAVVRSQRWSPRHIGRCPGVRLSGGLYLPAKGASGQRTRVGQLRLHDLHSGATFGPVGIWISILSGYALLFFAFSGLWMYIQMWRARHARSLKPGWFWK